MEGCSFAENIIFITCPPCVELRLLHREPNYLKKYNLGNCRNVGLNGFLRNYLYLHFLYVALIYIFGDTMCCGTAVPSILPYNNYDV